MDVNILRKLLASGQISPDQLNQMTISSSDSNPLASMMPARMDYTPQQNMQTQRLSTEELAPVAGMGFQGLQEGQGVVQTTNPDGTQNAPIYLDTPAPSRNEAMSDFSRPIDIAGVGKGYYAKDDIGSAIVNGKKVMLGVDREKTDARNERELKRQMQMAQMEETKARTAQLNAKSTPEQPKPIWDAERGVFITPPSVGGGPSVIPVSGLSAKEKPLTEAQGKAAGMGQRAQSAHELLSDFEGQGITTPSIIKQGAEKVWGIGPALGMAANAYVATPEQRKVDQLQRDFVNAALRTESGASISESEFDNARKQYFPQPGDDPNTILQKQQAREREIAALQTMAGSSGGASINAVKGKAPKSGLEQSKARVEARQAIARGADRAAVMERLKSMGIEGL